MQKHEPLPFPRWYEVAIHYTELLTEFLPLLSSTVDQVSRFQRSAVKYDFRWGNGPIDIHKGLWLEIVFNYQNGRFDAHKKQGWSYPIKPSILVNYIYIYIYIDS